MEMQTFWTQVKEKLEIVMERTEEMFPYTTQNGRFVPKDKRREFVTWWTNSFWTGMLWLMYRETGEGSYPEKSAAKRGSSGRMLYPVFSEASP